MSLREIDISYLQALELLKSAQQGNPSAAVMLALTTGAHKAAQIGIVADFLRQREINGLQQYPPQLESEKLAIAKAIQQAADPENEQFAQSAAEILDKPPIRSGQR